MSALTVEPDSLSESLHAWALPQLGARVAAVRLTASYREVLSHQPYPAQLAGWLGEGLAASALLMAGLKFEGRLSLQFQSPNALRLLYAECSSEGDLRGIARWQEGHAFSADFRAELTGGLLVLTLESARQRERHQGIVPLEGDNLAECLAAYFQQSEQLETLVLLAADGQQCAGLLAQRLPSEGGHATAVDPDGWNRIGHLLATVGPQELCSSASDTLLERLFHDETRLLREPRSLRLRCRCSRDKVSEVLRQIGREEALAAAESGPAAITCEFCGRVYRFDRVEIEQLFHLAGPASPRLQ